ncbi:MAG: VWA domain-containing protein [Myxococcota bacterium]|nr:VWA domain-containing protein [Myxococcota bacterium]
MFSGPRRSVGVLRAAGASFAACALALVIGQGCGAADRPPELGSGAGSPPASLGNAAPSGNTVPSFDNDAATIVPTCDLGPEGGVCACADQQLAALDPPNLYFVLDRSGSMNDRLMGANGPSKWDTVRTVLANLVASLGARANLGVAVFPNPNDNGCAPGVEIFAPKQVTGAALAQRQSQLVAALNRISANGGTPTAATLRNLLPSLRSLSTRTYVVLATDGGPNCDATAICAADQCTYNIESVVGCPFGGPFDCCTSPSYGGSLACLDAAATKSAVGALAAAGVPVYVIGIPGSAPYSRLLEEMATAGGTARPTSPHYFAVDSADQAALQAAMSAIAAKVTATCTLHLDNVPPASTLINVFFDTHVLPQAGLDGWRLTGSDVTILGASCQKILNGDVPDVRVVAGCPTVLK